MRGLRTFVTYGRFRCHHPDWPYVIGDWLALLVILAFLCWLAGYRFETAWRPVCAV